MHLPPTSALVPFLFLAACGGGFSEDEACNLARAKIGVQAGTCSEFRSFSDRGTATITLSVPGTEEECLEEEAQLSALIGPKKEDGPAQESIERCSKPENRKPKVYEFNFLKSDQGWLVRDP